MNQRIAARLFTAALVLATATPAMATQVTIHDPQMTSVSAIVGSAQMDDDLAEEVVMVLNDDRVVIVDSATGEKQFDSNGYNWVRMYVPGWTNATWSSQLGAVFPHARGADPFVDDDGDGIQCLMLVVYENSYDGKLAVVCPENRLPTAVSDDGPALGRARLDLRQNVPNPFNPSTEIAFELPASTPASLKVFDARGRLVVTLLDQAMGAGEHRVTWDGRDDDGRTVSSGAYFYQLEANGEVQTKKSILLK